MTSQPGLQTTARYILFNISQSKGYQTMKLGQAIEYKILSFKNYAENKAGRLVPDVFSFSKKALYQVKASGLHLSSNIFRYPSTQHTRKANCIKLQTIDSKICSILIFQKRVLEQFLHHMLCMDFKEKCLPCHVLLSEQISLSDSLCFLRYWEICVLQLFSSQVVKSYILKFTLCF